MRAWLLNSTSLVFLAIVLLVVLWIGSGMIGDEPTEPVPEARTATIPTVAASWREAEEITRELVLYGDVEPVQVSTLRARTDGIVEEIAAQGSRVEAGDIVARLSTDDREAQLARAEAQLAAAERDFNAARQLLERGVGQESEVQTRRAQLEAARAELRAIELEIENTELRAPIGGVISQLIADTGAYLSVGGEVLEIVDNDPLLAVVDVQQSSIARVEAGMPARVHFLGDGEKQGEVRFVSPIADADTRTFRVEVEIANEEAPLPSGLSAEVVIPTETVSAHRVSAALGRLDDQGRLGLYIVDEDDRIEFVPIEVIRARADSVWVTGLPERARIVTISQGRLAPGQQVEVEETPDEYRDTVAVDGPASGETPAEAAMEAR